MSEEIKSAEDLFNLLAGDECEVPSILIRGGKSKSAHQNAMIEQKKLASLAKVEAWMKSDNALGSDPTEFVSLGETLFNSICSSEKSGLSESISEKLRKLSRVWLDVSKSCKLLEPYIEASMVAGLMKAILRSKSLSVKHQEICARMMLAMVQCSPDRLFRDPRVIKAFNSFVSAWCGGKYRGNGSVLLSVFPVEFLSQLEWVGSSRSFVFRQELDLITRILKKRLPVQVDEASFLSFNGPKEVDEVLLKFCGALVRSKKQLSDQFRSWLKGVSELDPKKPGVSGKNILLAKQLIKH